jgi:hypothetical protein
MAARPADGIELAWCAQAGHAPASGEERAAGDICPLCQLPPSGPVPPVAANDAVAVEWIARPVRFASEIAVPPASHPVGPCQPRGPPAFA